MSERTQDTVTGAGPNLLALQHIACEPPGAYEDELATGAASFNG